MRSRIGTWRAHDPEGGSSLVRIFDRLASIDTLSTIRHFHRAVEISHLLVVFVSEGLHGHAVVELLHSYLLVIVWLEVYLTRLQHDFTALVDHGCGTLVHSLEVA